MLQTAADITGVKDIPSTKLMGIPWQVTDAIRFIARLFSKIETMRARSHAERVAVAFKAITWSASGDSQHHDIIVADSVKSARSFLHKQLKNKRRLR